MTVNIAEQELLDKLYKRTAIWVSMLLLSLIMGFVFNSILGMMIFGILELVLMIYFNKLQIDDERKVFGDN